MKRNLSILTLLLSLIFTLFFNTPVLADDPVPPSPEPIITDAEPSPTDIVEASITTDEPQEINVATLPEILSQLPQENTEVVVIVDNQIEPLATATAATALLVGDPIWCPDGDPPIPGVGNCTASYPDLLSLIDDIDTGTLVLPLEDGTIWIMNGTDSSSSDIIIDGTSSNFSGLANYSLNLQGGWDGTSTIGSNVIGSSLFSVPISIVNWNAQISINQIVVDNTSTTGLEIDTTGDVYLDDISSINNSGTGVEITTSSGSVAISGISNFSDNNESGLVINAFGDIDLSDISANGNGAGGVTGSGAELNSTSGAISLLGTNIFTNNLNNGITIDANQDVEIEKNNSK